MMQFTNVVKPTHLCNLDCRYCYNDDVRDPIMREETLARVIQQTFEYAARYTDRQNVEFIWHGGEPMIAGLPFFRRAMELQRLHRADAAVINSIQTNGTFIDDDWLAFLKQHEFHVGVSIDGPRVINDRVRVSRGGKSSFDKVLRAIERVREAKIPVGVCVVLSKANVAEVETVYDFVAEHRLPFNVIPLNRSGSAREHYAELGLEPEEYAEAWIRLYDRWFDADEDYVYCSDFVYKTRAILAGRPADCIGADRCAETNISVDPVGDVFPCATLSGNDDTRYGNLVESELADIMESAVARSYRQRAVDPQCSTCKWQHVCHGGCLARAYKFFGDHNRRDYYCPGLFRIYEHIAAKLTMRSRGAEAGPQARATHPSMPAAVPKPAPVRRLPVIS